MPLEYRLSNGKTLAFYPLSEELTSPEKEELRKRYNQPNTGIVIPIEVIRYTKEEQPPLRWSIYDQTGSLKTIIESNGLLEEIEQEIHPITRSQKGIYAILLPFIRRIDPRRGEHNKMILHERIIRMNPFLEIPLVIKISEKQRIESILYPFIEIDEEDDYKEKIKIFLGILSKNRNPRRVDILTTERVGLEIAARLRWN